MSTSEQRRAREALAGRARASSVDARSDTIPQTGEISYFFAQKDYDRGRKHQNRSDELCSVARRRSGMSGRNRCQHVEATGLVTTPSRLRPGGAMGKSEHCLLIGARGA